MQKYVRLWQTLDRYTAGKRGLVDAIFAVAITNIVVRFHELNFALLSDTHDDALIPLMRGTRDHIDAIYEAGHTNDGIMHDQFSRAFIDNV